MDNINIRPYRSEDASAVLAINAANVPEVGPMDRPKLEHFGQCAEWFPVVQAADEIVGFAILLVEGTAYGSPNYAWFCERFERFLYVDRIAVAAHATRQGIGRRLYEQAIAMAAKGGRPALCAEVNTIPPNPQSMGFHTGFGFQELGRTRPYGGDEEVSMLRRVIPAGGELP